jgi:hypothetical protein
VDLRELAAAASLPGRGAASASGELQLAAHGLDRAAIVASLQGQGQLRVRDVAVGLLEWIAPAVVNTAGLQPSPVGRRYSITTRFQVGDGRVLLDPFLLDRSGEQIEITGSVDFARRLDLRARALSHPVSAAASAPGGESNFWTVGGTLDAPLITPQPVAANRGGLPLASR